MDPSLIGNFIRFPTKLVWDSIATTYFDGSDTSRVYDLRCPWTQLKQWRLLEKYYNDLQGLWCEIDFRRLILWSLRPFPPWSKRMPMSAQALRQSVMITGSADAVSGVVLATKGLKLGSSVQPPTVHNGRPKSRTSSEGLKCSHCGNSKHTRDTYFKLHGYPDWWNDLRAKKGRDAGTKDEGSATAVVATAEPQLSFIPQMTMPNSGNCGYACYTSTNDGYRGAWLLDSGATDHMTFTAMDFTTTSLPRRTNIANANGLQLHNTLLVPSLSHKLLSVSQVTSDLNCIVLMYPTFCLLQDILTKEIIGRGTKRGGLYYMEDLSVNRAHHTQHTLDVKEKELWLWHRRFFPISQLDRFIPNRSAMDFDYAHYMLTEGRKGKENPAASSPSKEAYRKQMAETLNINRTRILAFKNKPPTPVELIPQEFYSASIPQQSKASKPRRHIPQTSERTLDAPDLVDDYYLNLLDWGSSNVLAIALGGTVYLWDASDGSTSELVTLEDESGPVTSVSWAPDGRHIAIGLNNSDVQLWDSTANRLLRTLKGGHASRVGSLAWNNHVLTTGGMDGKIINNDVRVRSHIVETYRGHRQEVCGLKWSASGQQLASGGNDNLLYVWDRSSASSNSPTQWLHRMEDHTAAVKALAWCPFQGNLLASGGGGGDRCIKFWNTHTGACLNSVDTGSQVCALLWNKNERELLSSHGFTQNQLTLWKYPSMVKMAELTGHTSRVLFMAQSPDGCTVASAAGDETLRFWNVFGTPEVAAKPAPKAHPEPFAHLNRIR
ncbi:hypothetical protein AAG906_023602 [Vitis piasezkii]